MTDTPAEPTSDAAQDDPARNGADAAAAAGPSFRILAQYTKDLSFENPHAPDSLREAGQPQIELGVEVGARGRQDGLFEVDVKLSATAQREGGRAAFQVELVYGGLFEIMGVPEEHVEPLLLIECPRHLFPFIRQIVAAATAEGGFPNFMLEPIDFGMLYAARQQQAQELAQTPPQGAA